MRSMVACTAFLMFLASCAHDPEAARVARMVRRATDEAVAAVAAETGCRKIRVLRTTRICIGSRRLRLVVKMNACGRRLIYERVDGAWRDATWRYM